MPMWPTMYHEGEHASDTENVPEAMPNRKAKKAFHQALRRKTNWAKAEHYQRDHECRHLRREASLDNLAKLMVDRELWEWSRA